MEKVIELNKIYNMDCMEGMKLIPDKSVDCIICDLPYGTTACKWDAVLPLKDYVVINDKVYEEKEYFEYAYKSNIPYDDAVAYFKENKQFGLWSHYNRIIKDNGAIVLFGSEPFTTSLINSNIKNFKHQWIWNKNAGANFMNVKYAPFKVHEDIVVFSSNGKRVNYYPQMEKGKERLKGGYHNKTTIYGDESKLKSEAHSNDLYYPKSILTYSNASKKDKLHETQKPVELVEYLIKTYSKESDIILDNCMGSGTTAVACINTNRNFIGFEKEEKYYNISQCRIKDLQEGGSCNE